MKILLRTTLASLAILGTAPLAMAAGAPQDDGSQLVVWIFLGMCALIVILQLVPLMILGFGTVKALLKGKVEKPVEVRVEE
jgi:hypothetical protein